MFFVDPRPDEFNNRDVMAKLAPCTKTVAEHKTQGSLQHRFISLLETGLFVERKNYVG